MGSGISAPCRPAAERARLRPRIRIGFVIVFVLETSVNLQEMCRQTKTLYSALMRDPAAEINAPLERDAPALFRALSPLGRRAFFPPDIPSQALLYSPVEGLPE